MVRDKISLSLVRPEHSCFLEAFAIGEGFKTLFQFIHSWEWVLPFSELPPSSDGDLGDSELECSSSVCTEDKLSPSFRLPLDFLGVLVLSFLLPSINCESICLRVSIDSYWARIISSCSLWAWACYSKRLAISSGVLIIYAKASFSTEKFKACDSAMVKYDSLTSMPRARSL